MSDYTRLTLRGSSTAADLVLPSDEPLAAMLPDILRLLDEPAAPARPLTLVTVLGEQLNTSLSLAEQQVHQGAIVSLVRLDEAPAPPEVADITQLAGDSIADRARTTALDMLAHGVTAIRSHVNILGGDDPLRGVDALDGSRAASLLEIEADPEELVGEGDEA